MSKDYYALLGLERGATSDDIKKAYRKLSKELHPDKTKGDKTAEDRYKQVNEAYEVLSDPTKKETYDRFGTADGAAGGFGGFDFSGFDGFSGGNVHDLGDLFENFFGGGGKGRARRAQDTRGEDIEVRLSVELADLIADAIRTIQIQKMTVCNDCGGKGTEKDSAMKRCAECSGTGQVTRSRQSFFGTMQQSFMCSTCNGAGDVPERPCGACGAEGRRQGSVSVSINIPAGMRDMQTLRVTGEGNSGRRGGSPGDLYVHVHVQPDPRFVRDGDDLQSTITIPAIDAILGATVNVATIHGDVALAIPEGTQSGTVLRIKNKGMPVLNTARHGHHIVTMHVDIPRKLSREERKLMEQWRAIHRK